MGIGSIPVYVLATVPKVLTDPLHPRVALMEKSAVLCGAHQTRTIEGGGKRGTDYFHSRGRGS